MSVKKIRADNDAPGAERSKGDLWNHLDEWLATAARARALTGSDLRIAVMLHRFAQLSDSVSRFRRSGQLVAFPGVDRLAAELGLERRTVQRSLKRLEANGLVKVERSRGGPGQTNSYDLILPNGGQDAALNGDVTAASRGLKRRRPDRPNPPPYGRDMNTGARRRGPAPSRDAGGPQPRAQQEELTAAEALQIAEADPQLDVADLTALMESCPGLSPAELLADLRGDLDEDYDCGGPSPPPPPRRPSRSPRYEDEEDEPGGYSPENFELLADKLPSTPPKEFIGLVEQWLENGWITSSERRQLTRLAAKKGD